MCGQQDQIKPVVDLINTIFYGDARHRLSLSLNGTNMLIMRGSYRPQGLFARLFCDLARPIRSANPSRSLRARSVRSHTNAVRTRKGFITSSKVYDNCPHLSLFAVASVQTDPPGLAVTFLAQRQLAAHFKDDTAKPGGSV